MINKLRYRIISMDIYIKILFDLQTINFELIQIPHYNTIDLLINKVKNQAVKC